MCKIHPRLRHMTKNGNISLNDIVWECMELDEALCVCSAFGGRQVLPSIFGKFRRHIKD